jgi:hypothetical protein
VSVASADLINGNLARAGAGALVFAVAACGPAPELPPPGPVATTLTVAVADTGWHTDVCIRAENAGAWLMQLPRDFDGARFLCFGFGNRQYMVEHDHRLVVQIRSMLPSDGAIVMTPVRDDPSSFFGAENVLPVGISRAGAAGLATFLRGSIAADTGGKPVLLATSPIPGRLYFSATDLYGGLYTCNSWTEDALRSAGLPLKGGALFAGEVLDQVKAIAAEQARSGAMPASVASAIPGAVAPAPAGSP